MYLQGTAACLFQAGHQVTAEGQNIKEVAVYKAIYRFEVNGSVLDSLVCVTCTCVCVYE